MLRPRSPAACPRPLPRAALERALGLWFGLGHARDCGTFFAVGTQSNAGLELRGKAARFAATRLAKRLLHHAPQSYPTAAIGELGVAEARRAHQVSRVVGRAVLFGRIADEVGVELAVRVFVVESRNSVAPDRHVFEDTERLLPVHLCGRGA